ncbi:riboflavin biosynthesis protein RibD [Lysobacteraceae bacterium NML120232]|nr:riboflavin biosynthesis protein RibD [Xanthomonadaceae bacterium NML08-0793]PJK11916.1 riboflavin biosynthesis protein RibD [Xanthomonadaceae bacterium NML120232]
MSAEFSDFDHAAMQRALALAERGAYTTRPNPSVGCVLAQGEAIVGEGWHQRKGGPHAEVFALQSAGEVARGATAYVTLEPCAHTGHTGPCADALIAAGVHRVVAAMRDPFPQVNGAGFDKLRAAGIRVQSGLLQAQARWLNRGFLSLIERGRPWLRLKMGASLDGRTALANGQSQWITGEAARADVQRYRARSSAILTGSGTALADNPRLTVRLQDARDFIAPLRVVLDTRLQTPAGAHLFDGRAPTLFLHRADVKPDARFAEVECTAIAHDDTGLSLPQAMRALAARGVQEIQVEAGAQLAGALLRGGFIDELLLYLAPNVLGDDARGLFAGLGLTQLADAPRFAFHDITRLGDDLRLTLLNKETPCSLA